MLKKLRSPLGCLLVSALLLMSGLVLLFVLSIEKSDPYIGEVLLPDGVYRLRLLKTVDGPLHYEWHPPAIRKYLPGPRLSSHRIVVELDGLDRWIHVPGHTFLFRIVDAQGRYMAPPRDLRFEFVESTGFVFKNLNSPDHSDWGTYALTRCALPRRDKELVIRIRDRTNPTSQPVEMTIPNPCYRPQFPVWQGETLPIEKTKGPVTVRLTGFDFGPISLFPQWKSAELTANSAASEWTYVSYSGYVFEDATGNQGNKLSPFEPAWKMKTGVYRTGKAEFPENLRTRLDKIPVPAPGVVTMLDRTLRIDDFECRVVCVAGPGIVRKSGGLFTARRLDNPKIALMTSGKDAKGEEYMEVARKSPFVLIEPVTGFSRDARIVVQTTRDGQRAECLLGHISTYPWYYTVAEIPTLPGTTEFDLTIALSRPEEFEFLITPPANARADLTNPWAEY